MESFDNIASEDSIEIEESSDSESNTVESSNVFIKKEPIKIYGGHQTRDFVYVNDVITCILKSVDLVLKSRICETVNVLTGKSISIENLANKISEISEFQPKIIYADLPDGDPEKSEGTVEKMLDLFELDINRYTKNFINGGP